MNAQMKLPFEEFEATAANDNRQPVNELEAKWREFHAANPHIYERFEEFAFQAINAGRERYAIKTILEMVRWHTEVTTNSTDGFKLCNNHTAYYAREFHRRNPKHAGFFKTHAVRGE